MFSEKQILKTLLDGKTLSVEDTSQLFDSFFQGSEPENRPESSVRASDAQIGAFLFALGARLPTADELLGGAQSMRRHMLRLGLETNPADGSFHGKVLLDTCGTGGSGLNSFNTSTLVALVAAAAGCAVVKHGNRSSTSACGSADLLEALGVSISQTPEQAARQLREKNFCFCFAPLYHQSTKRVQTLRKELGFRTIFNFLGPLVNPGEVDHQVLGVSSSALLPAMAKALLGLGAKRAFVVTGSDGLDEITLSGPSSAIEILSGALQTRELLPEEFGLPRYELSELLGSNLQENMDSALSILRGEQSARGDLVLANAGAALYLTGKATTLKEGSDLARSLLQSGSVLKKLEELRLS